MGWITPTGAGAGVVNADTLTAIIADGADSPVTRDGGTRVVAAGITGLRIIQKTGAPAEYDVVVYAQPAHARELLRARFTFTAVPQELAVVLSMPAPGVPFFTGAVVVVTGTDAAATFSVTPYLLEQG